LNGSGRCASNVIESIMRELANPARRRAIVTGAAVALFAAFALGVAPTAAQAGPLAVVEGESLDIKADKLDVDIDKGTALLDGNVVAKMGELTVSCPKVEIRYDQAPRVRWAKGSGGVHARVKGIDATANSVVLDLSKRQLSLSGGVRLARGKGWIEAGKATIDLSTRKVTLQEVKGSIPVEPPAR
jgi:lipopolysaccharide export system protein LptA